MALQPYDSDTDERYAPQKLQEAEHQAADSTAPSDARGLTTPDIAGAENRAADDKFGNTASEVNNRNSASSGSDDDTVGEKGYTGGGKKKGLLGKFRGLGSKKWLLVGGGIGGAGTIGIILLLFLLASSLKIPNLMQNITTYEFARLTRQYSQNAQRLTTEKLTIDSVTDETAAKGLTAKYAAAKGKVSEQWKKLDNYRPQKIIQNLGESDKFKLNYGTTKWGKTYLKGVTIGDRTVLPIQRGAVVRFTPGLKSIFQFKDNISMAKQIAPVFDTAIRANDVGPIIRGATARAIREKLGIGLVAWNIGKFTGKNAEQARLAEAQAKAAAIDNKTGQVPDNSTVESTKETVAAAEQEAADIADNPDKLAQAIKDGGAPQSIRTIIGNGIKKTGLQNLLGFVNPIYAVAMPVCIVYDGSLDRSGPTIDNQTAQQQRAYYYGASAADQQKAGSQDNNPANATALALATSATSDDFGDISQSNAQIRASGGTVDTSGSVSAEAGAGGEYTLLNASGLPSGVADTINSMANKFCPALTDTTGAIAIGVLNTALGFFTGESTTVAENSAGDAASAVVQTVSKNLLQRVVDKVAAGVTKVTVTGSKLRTMLLDTGKSATKVAAATIVAKLIVNARAGQINGGFTQGLDLANEADSGGNITAGEIGRQGQYGRPLTAAETSQSDSADLAFINDQNQSKSAYQRYFATSNAQSLLSRMAIGLSGNINASIFRSLVNIASTLFRPMTYLGSFATSLSGSAHAATTDSHYGNVQFGWSQDEENLIDSNESYSSSLENQAVLDASGKENEIASKYGGCFTKSLGDLLSNTSDDGGGDIIRDSDGNVISDKGLCSPNNLGPTNSQYGDLVFRWRLAQSYSNTLDQLTGLQDVATTSATGVAP